jgi:hypothetical protein
VLVIMDELLEAVRRSIAEGVAWHVLIVRTASGAEVRIDRWAQAEGDTPEAITDRVMARVRRDSEGATQRAHYVLRELGADNAQLRQADIWMEPHVQAITLPDYSKQGDLVQVLAGHLKSHIELSLSIVRQAAEDNRKGLELAHRSIEINAAMVKQLQADYAALAADQRKHLSKREDADVRRLELELAKVHASARIEREQIQLVQESEFQNKAIGWLEALAIGKLPVGEPVKKAIASLRPDQVQAFLGQVCDSDEQRMRFAALISNANGAAEPGPS